MPDNRSERTSSNLGDTLGGKIATEFLNSDPRHREVRRSIYLGLILLVFSIIVNLVAQIERSSLRPEPGDDGVSATEFSAVAAKDRLAGAELVNRGMEVIAWLSAATGVALLGILVC